MISFLFPSFFKVHLFVQLGFEFLIFVLGVVRKSTISFCWISQYLQVITATKRADILDPALMRSGHLDRKLSFPIPLKKLELNIAYPYSRKLNVKPDVNFEEFARSTYDFNGVQLKSVCVEDGMIALRRFILQEVAIVVSHEIAHQWFGNHVTIQELPAYLHRSGRTATASAGANLFER